ncbi:hypothetical protein LR48_Vigan393s002100 [Vigna angularis]|uniref:KIB1-4 beta-propeller domain-containing protein n=1 Tax=Phaseolus angularis TaxID=3914 RepID=A0A0L9T945_PHAAN|nr:uncharacterized protein HKW66_Vig0006730 [Vigna angularis]KOM27077.1 hypothetical protein LR48_Vigan393s002100 [Vigna angularis]
MALKAKNKKNQQQNQQNPRNNQDLKSKSWLDLPKNLHKILEGNPNLHKNINGGGIIKSWRSPPKQCNPHSKLPAFGFCKLKGSSNGSWITPEPQWTMQDCTLTEPLGSQQKAVQFTNAIGFQGKFYALSVQGSLVVIEDVDSVAKVTDLSGTRIFPLVSSNHFREYLVESEGEILLVFILSRKSRLHGVDGVEVYQLNVARVSWIKVESVGEQAVFVGSNCSLSVLASEVGCRRNCIYFRNPVADEWTVYDMQSGSFL